MTTGSLTGTTALAKLALRRDRIMLPVWIYVVVIGVSANAYAFVKLYTTASSRAALVASARGNPALLFLYGRLNGTSAGALAAWRYGVWGGLFAALMSIFIVIRHSRADEEAGRLELIGSARVGRQAPLVSAIGVAALANVVIVAVLCVVLPLLGLPAAGSVALSLAIGTCGLAFAGIAAVTAQLASGARAARGLAFGVLGVAFLARAVGDSAGVGGPSWLTWVLPLGWTEEIRPFAGERWWVLALPVALCAAGVGLAFTLAAHRDYGAGLLPDRPGRPFASRLLRGPFSLAWRLQWGTLAGWAAGYAILFAVCGAAGKGIGQLVGSSGALEKEFTRLGGQAAIVNAYLASLMLLAGLGAAGYAVSAALRLRAEETEGRADPVLAGAVGRVRWGLSHVVVAVAGPALLLAIAGVSTGLGYGLRAGGTGWWVSHMLGAGLAELPAALVIAGVAIAVFGLLPQVSAAVSWTAVGLAVALNIFGQVIQLSHWVLDISPFTHVPRLPGGTVSASPLLWLSVIAVVLGGTGLAALRRRDIGSALSPHRRFESATLRLERAPYGVEVVCVTAGSSGSIATRHADVAVQVAKLCVCRDDVVTLPARYFRHEVIATMRSGWPHTQADHGRLPADRRRGRFGPDISWPTGYSDLEYREGDYRYSAPAAQARAAQPPAAQGQHPYADLSAAGYGDDGYRDAGYDGPAAQDAGYAQPGYPPAAPSGPSGPSGNGYGRPGRAGPGYGNGGGQVEPAYPAPAPQDYQGPDAYRAESRWQAWDYDQPLRYDDERQSHPGQDSHGPRPGDYRGSDGYGPDAYHAAPVYEPANYNGSEYSRPGIDGPGYDLTGIIGTGDFEAFGYDEPSYDRLSYDDPRYDDGPRGGGYPGPHPGGGPRLDETRMDMRALGAARSDERRFDVPRFDETRLDSLWLSDEDVRHDEPVGYENDGFGGDAPARSGFSAFGAPGGPRLNETRMDLRALGTARSDETRFDVPAYDETRIDGMRAMGSRPSATGLLVPPDDRPRSWAEETSFDDFGDYGVLDDEPVRAPAAFVRTAERPDHLERPDDTATRRAIGRRRGRSGDRRQWMALGAIAVVAAGAIGGVLVKFMHSGPGGPAHTVVAPNQANGFTRSANLEKQMKVDSLSQSVMQSSSGQASNLVSAVYEQGNAAAGANAQIFMFVGGKLAGASPSASVASFEQSYPGAKVVPAGSLGGDAVCAERQLNGEGVAMCVWFDNDSFGALVSPTMSTAKLATTLDAVRPSLELYAK